MVQREAPGWLWPVAEEGSPAEITAEQGLSEGEE